ncbi:hypothetical protein EDB89DRAFT_1906518 [Lactarius sanguifluus]|nr:hypothetical protein EDB89DRAFT_1906518 [Lactarius sanguifluus]
MGNGALQCGKVCLDTSTRRHWAPFYVLQHFKLQSSTVIASTFQQLNNWYRLARGPPPLLQGKPRRGHAIHHTTMPYPLAPTPPPRCWASAHSIKYRLACGQPPLLQGKHRCGHAIHHTTTPCPLAPTPLPRCWASAHYIKINLTPLSPPPPPPCSTQARGGRLQRIAMDKSATTTTPYSVQELPQRHPHMARNPHRYDTNNDGDAAAGTAWRQERR